MLENMRRFSNILDQLQGKIHACKSRQEPEPGPKHLIALVELMGKKQCCTKFTVHVSINLFIHVFFIFISFSGHLPIPANS